MTPRHCTKLLESGPSPQKSDGRALRSTSIRSPNGGIEYAHRIHEWRSGFNQKRTPSARDLPSRLHRLTSPGIDTAIGIQDYSGTDNEASPIRRGCFLIRRAPWKSKTSHRRRRKETATKRSGHQCPHHNRPQSGNVPSSVANATTTDVPPKVDLRQLPNYILRLSDNRSRPTRPCKFQSSDCCAFETSEAVPDCRNRVLSFHKTTPDHLPKKYCPDNCSINIFNVSPIREQSYSTVPSDTNPGSVLGTYYDARPKNSDFYHVGSTQREQTKYEECYHQRLTYKTVHFADSTCLYHGNINQKKTPVISNRITMERLSRTRCRKIVKKLCRARRYFLGAETSNSIVMRTLAVL